MSSGFVSIVPVAIELEHPEETAVTVVGWLAEKEIIIPRQTDCVLGSAFGFPPGPRYKDALERGGNYWYFEEFNAANGLEVITGRTVFHAGGNGLSAVTCPCCRADIIDNDAWGDFLAEWVAGGTSHLPCPECGQKSLLNAYDFTIEQKLIWAFSNFGLTFWNWPGEFKAGFIGELEDVIGTPVKIVYGRI